MTLGARLTAERKRLKKTVLEFANDCAVSKSAQINFEKDRQAPGSAYLLAASRLGVDVGFVLVGKPGIYVPGLSPDRRPEIEELIDDYLATTSEIQERVRLMLIGAPKPTLRERGSTAETSDEKKLLKRYRDLGQVQREQALNMLKVLALGGDNTNKENPR